MTWCCIRLCSIAYPVMVWANELFLSIVESWVVQSFVRAFCPYTQQHTATHSNTQQHTATHSNTQQHTATPRKKRREYLEQHTNKYDWRVGCNAAGWSDDVDNDNECDYDNDNNVLCYCSLCWFVLVCVGLCWLLCWLLLVGLTWRKKKSHFFLCVFRRFRRFDTENLV